MFMQAAVVLEEQDTCRDMLLWETSLPVSLEVKENFLYTVSTFPEPHTLSSTISYLLWVVL